MYVHIWYKANSKSPTQSWKYEQSETKPSEAERGKNCEQKVLGQQHEKELNLGKCIEGIQF